MVHVHIYSPPCVIKSAVSGICPDCGKRTRFLAYSYEWYAGHATCIRCGRSFNEDGWVPLPFVRGARQKEIAAAKERFRRTVAIGIDEVIRRADSATRQ